MDDLAGAAEFAELIAAARRVRRWLEQLARLVRRHPMPVLAGAGFAVACVVVVAGARVDAARSAQPLVNWFGLENEHHVVRRALLPGIALLIATLGLLALWLAAVFTVRRLHVPVRHVWFTAGAWAVPFLAGPPIYGTTVYSYVAYGLLQRDGIDPYRSGPAALGNDPVVAAIEASYRARPSAAGPLGSLLQHLAVSASNGNALGGVLVLRLFAVIVALWLGRTAAELAGRRAHQALAGCLLNPLVLLFVVSGARLDGLLAALLVGALLAARRRHWTRAVALAAIAGCVLPQGLLAVPAFVAAHAVRERAGRVAMLRVVGRDGVVAAAIVAAAGFGVPNGFGWVGALVHQFADHTPFGAANVIGLLFQPIVRAASYDDLFDSGAVTALTAAAAVVIWLLVTVRRRPLDRTVGYSMLAVALLGLTLRPWYFLWGLLPLLPRATGARRRAALALSGVGLVVEPPGFADATAGRIGLVLLAGAALGWLARERLRSAREGDEPGAPRGNRRHVAGTRHLRRAAGRDVDRAQHGLEDGDRLDHRERGAEAAADAAAERDPGGRRRVVP